MPIRDFRDLVAWRLSYAVKCEAEEVSATAQAARDFKFSDQLLDASRSAPRNIAEGYGRFRSREYAYFLSIARASLIETENHLIDARDRGYLRDADFSRLRNLTRAARKATTGLMRYHQRRTE